MEKKFCRDIIALLFLVLLCLKIPAQQRAFKVGDVLPEDFWTKTHPIVNSPKKTTTFGENRDKLILLDFWATWCGSCLQSFLKLQPIEKELEGQLKVIPVSYESRETLEKFFQTKNGKKYHFIESISDDKILTSQFLPRAYPYVVWIKDGKVLNLTDSEQVTPENIKKVLQGQNSVLQTVLQLDSKRPIMLAEQFDLERDASLVSYQFLAKGLIRAINYGNKFHRSGSITYGRQFKNRPLINIYRGIVHEIFQAQGDQFSSNRIINQSENADKLRPPQLDDPKKNEKYYSFEFTAPISRAKSLYPDMLNYLNQNTEYLAEIKKIRRKCFVLTKNANFNKSSSAENKEGAKPKKSDSKYIVNELNELPIVKFPLIIESGLDLEISKDILKLDSFDEVKLALGQVGFNVKESERELLMLVITDRK
ncbi:TlpA family protein disulfide reductase [Chryseobacterium sp. A321]